MAARKPAAQPAPEPTPTADFVPEYHKPADDSEIKCFDAIRAALGDEGFINYLRGEIMRRSWALSRKSDDPGDMAAEAQKLEWFAAQLNKMLDI